VNFVPPRFFFTAFPLFLFFSPLTSASRTLECAPLGRDRLPVASPKLDSVVWETQFAGVHFLNRGKVRDLYEVGGQLLLVATDRLSAFDVVLPTPIPEKGRVLTQLSLFWFNLLRDILPNHVISATDFPAELTSYRAQLEGRAMLCRRTSPLPIECVVRGYLSGSGWKDYRATGKICGISLPPGLRESERLPHAIFTPSTKATAGHDENISFDDAVARIGGELAERVRAISLEIYRRAAAYAEPRGIILADTKFEFGLAGDGSGLHLEPGSKKTKELIWIDEALTPDSSRFWPADGYEPGRAQPSFDKQYVRDYLERIGWNKQPPGPELPPEVVAATRLKYREAYRQLAGHELS
jgi:phosphoribosylaminoimidazole-succinocarboxamide synthase